METKVKPIVSALQVSPRVTQLPWTYHSIIFSQAKPPETRGFYMLAAIRDWWTKARARTPDPVGGSLHSDAAASEVSPAVAQINPTAFDELKDAYRVELSSVVTRRSEQHA